MKLESYRILILATSAVLILLAFHVLALVRYGRKRKSVDLKLKGQNLALTQLYGQLEAAEAELRKNYGEIAEMAFRDLVTNLPNRVWLERNAEECLWDDISALILFDIDKFRNINQAYGHFFGDQVLVYIAEKLKSVAAEEGLTLARLECDEFAVLPMKAMSRPQIEALIARILDLFQQSTFINNCLLRISFSCGVALPGEAAPSFDKLLRNAYLALEKAKKRGRDRYHFFENEMITEMSEKLTIEGKLQIALERGDFCLHYQPQIDMRTNRICGLEALVRWKDQETGLRYPVDFIQIAEETGQILFVGEAVLREACAFETRVARKFGKVIPLSVNVSCHQLGQYDFVEFVRNVTSEFDLKPEYLSIEITESTLIDSFDDSIDKIMKLKELGINIHLDDFGTGYSSLNYIKNLPIDVIKIDRVFIHDLGKPQADSLIEFIIALAHKLGKGIIAEGVETKEQWERLVAYGCDIAQGYFMGKPETEEKITAMLRDELGTQESTAC